MSFVDDLSVKLTLTLSNRTFAVSGGDIKALNLDLHPYGYRGWIEFLVSAEQAEDTLLSPIGQDDPIDVALEVGTYIKPAAAPSEPLQLKGLATAREFSELTISNVPLKQDPVLYRLYRLEFADPAQVLWTQHFPCDLLTEATLKTLLTSHTGDRISLQCDWDALDTQHSHIALSLGAPGNRASFHDFVLWLVDRGNGVFAYDAANNRYGLSARKAALPPADPLDFQAIAEHRVDFPEIARHQPRVLNACADNPQTKPVDNTQAVTPIRQDHLARYPVAADLEARVTLETARLKLRKHEVALDYRRFPLKTCPPGHPVKFDGAGWSSALFVHGKTYRVRDWRLEARTAEKEITLGHGLPYGRYEMQLGQRLECTDEDWVPLPPYEPPLYPFYVEGQVVSEQGEDQDATWQVYQDQDTSAEYYQVGIPLWDDKKVRAPFEPGLLTGQFYFPLYKNARVLVGLDLYEAHIAGVLDWEAGARLPLDSQGNQLVMGKSATSRTSLKHVYVDEKPELQLQRTQDQDTELLKLAEGSILLQTMEQET